MPKFAITLWERVGYDMVVEADDESEAAEAAEAMFVQSGDPTRDFCGTVEERSAGDPEEMPDDTTVTEVNGNGSPPYVLQQAALDAIAAFPEIYHGTPLDGADAVDRLAQTVLPALRAALEACGVAIPEPAGEPDEDEPESVVGILEPRGYQHMHTGGGCQAWVRTMDGGDVIVVTNTDGGGEPLADDWLIGRYATDDWLDEPGLGYSDTIDEEGDKTVEGFAAALDRVEARPVREG